MRRRGYLEIFKNWKICRKESRLKKLTNLMTFSLIFFHLGLAQKIKHYLTLHYHLIAVRYLRRKRNSMMICMLKMMI
jgi:hypothetical protein